MTFTERTIGGMSYESYNPDMDPTGEIGHALASQRVMQQRVFTPRRSYHNNSTRTQDRNARYKSLISRAQGLYVEDAFRQVEMERRILQEIFPGKFGRGGK